MGMSAGASSGTSSEINVTPLIDVLLVLLIIFMVLVPIEPRGLSSALPQDKSVEVTSQPPVVELIAGPRVDEVSYRVNYRAVPREAVGPTLSAIFAMQPENTVLLQADRKLSYGPVAQAASEAKRAGASAIVLSQSKP